MQVIYNLGQLPKKIPNPVAAIGIFDGIHVGHQALIKQTVNRAKKIKGASVVLTFFPHPVHVLHPEVYLPYIISLSHRLKLLDELGIDFCIVITFTKTFSRLSPEQFIKNYLVRKLKVKEVFVGDDFRFGADRQGTSQYFKDLSKKYSFVVNAIHPLKGAKGKVSSTEIRKLIEEGDLRKAEYFLGRPVSFMGKVIKGDSRGALLGFPTANLEINNEILPPRGVYAVRIIVLDKKYSGMANVGFRPSFKKRNRQMNLEVHIFDFNKKIYGEVIIVEFFKKIREEKIFSSPAELIHQLKKDEVVSRNLLK
jgi:riboflavin kinase / FMN adenylyltransferase